VIRWLLFALLLLLPTQASSQVCHIPPSFPDATNTGYLPTGVTLPAANHCNSAPAGWSQGSATLNVTGTYDGCNFASGVRINANSVTLKRSYVFADGTNSVDIGPGTTGALLQDVEVAGPGDAGLHTDGANNIYFEGSGTALRMNVYGSRNCWTIMHSGVTIQDSYCHNFGATNSGSQHWDGVMDDGGNKDNLVVTHNTILNDRWNSAIMTDNWGGALNDATLSQNHVAMTNPSSQNFTIWCDGRFSSASITNWSATNNLVGWGGYGYASVQGTCTASPVWNCNLDDTTYRTIANQDATQNSGTVEPVANPSCVQNCLSLACTGGIRGPGTATSYAWSGDCGMASTQNATLTCPSAGVKSITFQVNNGSWSDAWTIPVTAGPSAFGPPGQRRLVP